MSSLGIRPLYDRIITKSSVKKVLVVTNFPTNLKYNFSSAINRNVSLLHPDCDVIVTTQNFNSDLKQTVRGKDFKKNMSLAEERATNYEIGMNQLSDTERTTGKSIRLPGGAKIHVSNEELKRLKDNYKSYKYVYDSVVDGNAVLTSYVFLELIAPDNKRMRALMETVDDLLTKMECGFTEIRNANSKYLSSMSPTGYFYRENGDKNFHTNLLTSENLGYLMPYMSNGFIGDGSGTLMGLDIGSRAPFILNFNKTGDRQIIAYIVPSGKGKTMTSNMIALFMVGQGVHCSAFDVKGEEWNKLKVFIPSLLEINVSSAGGSYVNTMRLDDIVDLINGDKLDAEQFLASAKESTVEIVKIMSSYTNPNTPNYADAVSIIERGVSKYFSTNNVMARNYKTFSNTSNMNYKDLVNFIGELKSDVNFKDNINVINSVVTRSTSFMDTNTIFEGKEITIKEVLESPLVVYSFNKNRDGVSNEVVDSIRTFMFTYLDMKKIYIRKMRKLSTTCFYEELQRKEEFARLIKFINAIVTGARSSNVTVFLLCNSPRTFIDPSLSGVTSNISTYILGPVAKNDYPIIEQLGMGDLIPRLEEMTDNPDKYNHCFLCKFDTGIERDTCIFTAMVPPRVKEALKSRDTEE